MKRKYYPNVIFYNSVVRQNIHQTHFVSIRNMCVSNFHMLRYTLKYNAICTMQNIATIILLCFMQFVLHRVFAKISSIVVQLKPGKQTSFESKLKLVFDAL